MRGDRFRGAVLAMLALALAGGRDVAAQPPAFKPPTAADSFEMHFNVPLPHRVRVVHYYGDTIGMDPSFAWDLTPVDDAMLKALVRKYGLKRASRGVRPESTNVHWPAWWRTQQIESLPEVYFKNESSALIRAWVDRKQRRVYIEFANL